MELTDEKLAASVDCVCVFGQHEVSSDLQTSTNEACILVSVTDSHMKPIVVIEKLDLTR